MTPESNVYTHKAETAEVSRFLGQISFFSAKYTGKYNLHYIVSPFDCLIRCLVKNDATDN